MHRNSTGTPFNLSVGVGLRHEHYFDAVEHPANIDFVEVHAENFFANGGAAKALLIQAREKYELSIHATSLGLGSILPPNHTAVSQLKALCDEYSPQLVSDHACFNRATIHGKEIHTGDLLPLRFNQDSLDILCKHVDLVQTKLKRHLLIENLSAYLPNQQQTMSEFEFLTHLCKKTGCKLLLDLNNLLVNAHNARAMSATESRRTNSNSVALDDISLLDDPIKHALHSIDCLESELIGEYHLAGTTPVKTDEIMIDDHAETVSETCWKLYDDVLKRFGTKPTLIEWDQALPSWQALTELAETARTYQNKYVTKPC